MLIYGVHKYGMGNWDQIREDKSLGLDTKISNQEELDDGIKVKVFFLYPLIHPPFYPYFYLHAYTHSSQLTNDAGTYATEACGSIG